MGGKDRSSGGGRPGASSKVSGTGASSSSSSGKPQQQSRSANTKKKQHLKLLVRNLPPKINEEQFKQTFGDDGLAGVIWLRVKGGKETKRSTTLGAAWLGFKTKESLVAFGSKYAGHKIVTAKGETYELKVQYSPYSKLPASKSKASDRYAGSIDDDPQYLAFLATLKEEPEPRPNVEQMVEEVVLGTPSNKPVMSAMLEALNERARDRWFRKREKKSRDRAAEISGRGNMRGSRGSGSVAGSGPSSSGGRRLAPVQEDDTVHSQKHKHNSGQVGANSGGGGKGSRSKDNASVKKGGNRSDARAARNQGQNADWGQEQAGGIKVGGGNSSASARASQNGTASSHSRPSDRGPSSKHMRQGSQDGSGRPDSATEHGKREKNVPKKQPSQHGGKSQQAQQRQHGDETSKSSRPPSRQAPASESAGKPGDETGKPTGAASRMFASALAGAGGRKSAGMRTLGKSASVRPRK